MLTAKKSVSTLWTNAGNGWDTGNVVHAFNGLMGQKQHIQVNTPRGLVMRNLPPATFLKSVDAAAEATTWPVWQRAALPKPSRPLADPLRLVTHPVGAQGQCVPTWQRGADGTMWLECQHLRYVVEE